MSDKPREWPNVMAGYRDGAADELVQAERQLEGLVAAERPMTETERLLKLAQALVSVQKALRFLESAGAQTRPSKR